MAAPPVSDAAARRAIRVLRQAERRIQSEREAADGKPAAQSK